MTARRPLQALIYSMIDATFFAGQGMDPDLHLDQQGYSEPAINDIEHPKNKANYPATNGILEAFV
jgi:hypothetical protein